MLYRCVSRAELAASCSALLVAGERETGVRPSNAALVALMPHATARYVRRTGHGRLGLKAALHQEMVGAWLAGRDLPDDLEPETAVWSRATVGRAMGRPG